MSKESLQDIDPIKIMQEAQLGKEESTSAEENATHEIPFHVGPPSVADSLSIETTRASIIDNLTHLGKNEIGKNHNDTAPTPPPGKLLIGSVLPKSDIFLNENPLFAITRIVAPKMMGRFDAWYDEWNLKKGTELDSWLRSRREPRK